MAATNGASNGKRKGIRRTSTGSGRPAWQRLTRRQRDEFLEHVRAGKDRSQATAEVGAPRGSFRALCRHDPLFEADYEAARKLGYDPKTEQLLNRMWMIAMEPENPSSLRACQSLLMLYSSEYRSSQMAGKLGVALGAGDGKLEVVLAFLGDHSEA